MKVVMLSEGDSAGSGSRISKSINKHCKDIDATFVVKRAKRKIGHFNPDFILSDSDVVGEVQKIIDHADIVHFKDDEPISRIWNGLVIPERVKIVHTAGGSSFRTYDFEVSKEEFIDELRINFTRKWKNQKRFFGRLIHTDNESIQIDGMNYSADSHNNVWSGMFSLPSKSNCFTIKGKQLLIEEGSGKEYDIRSIIVRYFNSEGQIIQTSKKNIGSLLGKKTDFEITFPTIEGCESIRFSFFTHKIYRTNYEVSNLSLVFSRISDKKFTKLKSQFSVSNKTWPIDSYAISDLGTVLTPDLLHRENKRIVTPHVKPTINKRKKKKKGKRVVIAHAPSNTGKKGTAEFVLPAIEELRKKHDIEFNLIQNVSHDECLDMISRSDIFIDQMVAGYYGNAGLEAMTMGIPVLAYISDDTLELAGKEWEKIPILRIRELSVDSVVSVLDKVLMNRGDIGEIGNKCKQWVNKFHSEKRIASMWRGIYQNVLSENKSFRKSDFSTSNYGEETILKNPEYLLRGGGSWSASDVSPCNSVSILIDCDESGGERGQIRGTDKFFSWKNDVLIEIYRIGWYGGKGARLVHRKRLPSITSENVNEKQEPYFFDHKSWPKGCYRAIISDKNKKTIRHFILHERKIENRNLIIFPKISSVIWADGNESERKAIYDFENFRSGHGYNSLEMPDDLGGIENKKTIDWLFSTIYWFEKNNADYDIICETEIEDIEFKGSGAVIFVGENRFWTPEIHAFIETEIINNSRDLVILGSGFGERMTYHDKKSNEIIFPFSKHKQSRSQSPVSFGSLIEGNRKFKGYSNDNQNEIQIKNVVDKYKKNLNFSKRLMTLDGEEHGEISSRHFILQNGANIIHGGIMDFSTAFLDPEKKPGVGEPVLDIIRRIIEPKYHLHRGIDVGSVLFKEVWSEDKLSGFKTEPTICLVSAMWKRPMLTRKIFQHYQRLKNQLEDNINLVNIAIGSEGTKSRKIAERADFEYIEHPNFPLSKKWDNGIKYAKKFDPDAILIVGSDDIIDSNLLLALIEKIREGRLVVGIKDLFIYDKRKSLTNYWPGYSLESGRNGETIGLSRLISRDLLEILDFSLWPDLEINKALDLYMTNRFIRMGLLPRHSEEEQYFHVGDRRISNSHSSFFMRDLGGIAIDVKTSTNISPIESYELMTESVDYDVNDVIENVIR